MEPIKISDVCGAAGGELAAGDGQRRIERISTDTRTLARGDFFIALRGKNYDGHDHIGSALERGSLGIMYDHEFLYSGGGSEKVKEASLVKVSDTMTGFHDIARWYRKRFQIPLIAVTGSNGKTTTKEMIRTIASGRYSVLASEGTFNNQFGVPLTLMNLERRHEVAVLEIGMNARGEIKRLAGIACPTIGVVTNVGPAHLEFLRSVENVAASKAELLDSISSQGGGTAILNCDDPLVSRMGERNGVEVRTFGMKRGADVRGESVREEEGRVSARIRFRKSGRAVTMVLPVAGVHNVYNALAAAAVCEMLGMDPDEMAERLADFRTPPMRTQVLHRGGIVVINDAYNANPASMRAAIETLAAMRARGKKVLVAGDMRELGEAADEAHGAVGRLAAERGIDLLIAVGEYRMRIAEAAHRSGMPPDAVITCSTVHEAAQALNAHTGEGDCVLLKASRRVGLEDVLKEWLETSS
ncbi:MAG: UDP-N-acetylmuramoyl-tripeptide--D-alanyl-D-alanine ligase [Candidatus Aureabacteria bacterium]|nr:UDP-N-acetylmuramoyl-tripeptide--D-alanyl-D-alanine ligase [Candidatus Auribacterota bacterium]